jgi:aminopeptidase N
LPRVARPERYDLAFWLDPHAATYTGTVGIDLDVLQPTTVLWLNATDLRIESAALEAAGASITPRVLPGGDDFVGFVFDHELAPGKARLTVRFQGSIDPERSRGIYSSREGDGETYLYTFFEPIDARRAFPCFDEPSYKVPWKVSLHVPRADVALSNAPVTAEHDEEGGRKVVEMAETKPLPSYLVAFVVGPFDVVDAGTAGHHGTPLRFIVPKGRGPETAYAQRITPKLVGALEDYFGMAYPYGKLDVAVVPRYWGTMEHPGIVAMGQPLTLIAPGQDSVEREQHYADIAVHELAHYWFGDYVTTAWWDDTWLNEALGTWMDETATAAVEPGWGFDFERIARAGYGMRVDALGSAKRIRQPVETKDDIENSFDSAITYYKGQAVLSMFEGWMGKGAFQDAIRRYVANHAWGNATAEDFFGAMNQELPGAGAAMKTFVDQPGFPAIAMEVHCAGKDVSVTVKQHRYHGLDDALDAETWTFPVCLRYPLGKGASGVTCAVLSGETATLPLRADACPAWIVGNADGAGYYGVDYTPAELRAALGARDATDADRIALLRDAGQLVGSGELPLGDALAFVAPTASSGRRQIVQAGMDLVGMARTSALTEAQAKRKASFLRATYGAAMGKLGLARRAGEDGDAQRIRPTLIEAVAVAGDDERLRSRARALAFAWLKDEHAIAPELVDAVLEAAAKSNDERLFAALLERAHAESDHTRLSRLLGALGAFTAPALVRQADELLASNAFDVRDALVIVRAQLADRASQEQAWAFVKASFDAVSSRMRSDDVLVGYFRPVQGFCDVGHQHDVQEFFAPRAARFDGGPRALANAVEAIGQCAAVLQRNVASLDAFLARY